MEEENKDTIEKNETVEISEANNEEIKIADDVVSVIAGKAVSEISGVAGMAGGFAGGISEVFSGKKNLSKGIKVDVGEKEVKIDVNIIVEYGARIPDIAFEIQNRVKKAVETMTGLTVTSVNVHVQGVNIPEEKEEPKNEEEEEKFNLILFSIIILIISVLVCFLQFGWIDVILAYNGISFLVENSVAGNISLGLAIILILLSIKSIFFNSYSSESQGKDGILLENDNGKLLVSRDTIESLANTVIKSFDSAETVMTKVEVDEESHIKIYITLSVHPDAVIKDLSAKLQSNVKEAIKKSLDLDVTEVNIRVKNISVKKEPQIKE